MARRRKVGELVRADGYAGLLTGISALLAEARRNAARTVNSILSAAYWEIGRRIVEYEQAGRARAEYGESLLKKLGQDLTAQHGRGFSWRNLFSMRRFFLGWEILQTPSAIFEVRVRLPDDNRQTASAESEATMTRWPQAPAALERPGGAKLRAGAAAAVCF